jgi:hypothetical protein
MGEILGTFFNPNYTAENQMIIADVPIIEATRSKSNADILQSLDLHHILRSVTPNVDIFTSKPGFSSTMSVTYGNVNCTVSFTIRY